MPEDGTDLLLPGPNFNVVRSALAQVDRDLHCEAAL